MRNCMVKKSLNLFIEKHLINKIKRISNKKQVAISRLVENYIKDLKESNDEK